MRPRAPRGMPCGRLSAWPGARPRARVNRRTARGVHGCWATSSRVSLTWCPAIDHFGDQLCGLDAAKRFYDQTRGAGAPAGQRGLGVAIGYGTGRGPDSISGTAGPNRRCAIAFRAADAATVRACHGGRAGRGDAARASSAAPSTTPGYYGAFVRRPRRQQRRGGCHSASDGDHPGTPAWVTAPPAGSVGPRWWSP